MSATTAAAPANGQALQTAAPKSLLTPMQKKQKALQAQLEGRRLLLVKALPSHINAEAFWRKIMFACFKNPDLLDCNPMTVIEAVTKAAQLGLDPTGLLGEGYLIPYKDTCEFVPGYQGLISLARRSGHIVSIEARAVYEGDHFECFYGLESNLIHRPDWENDNTGNPDKLRFVYAVAKLTGGGVQFDVMPLKAILRIKAASPGASSRKSPWNSGYFIEMALKTVIRRIFKYLPKSADLEKALAIQEGGEQESGAVDLNSFDLESLGGVLPPAPASGVSKLKARLPQQQVGAGQDAPLEAESAPAAESAPESEDEKVMREAREAFEAAETAK